MKKVNKQMEVLKKIIIVALAVASIIYLLKILFFFLIKFGFSALR